MAQLWTATSRGLTPGIPIPTTGLRLGEQGRSRREVVVSCEPALLGASWDAASVAISGANRVELARGHEGDAVVVRITTCGTYTRGCPGHIKLGSGWSLLAEGCHAWGTAGNLGAMPDALIGCRAEGVARIVFSGGRRKGAGGRWLVALQRGADVPSLWLWDAHPDARPELGTAATTWDASERARVLTLIEALPGLDAECLQDAKDQLVPRASLTL